MTEQSHEGLFPVTPPPWTPELTREELDALPPPPDDAVPAGVAIVEDPTPVEPWGAEYPEVAEVENNLNQAELDLLAAVAKRPEVESYRRDSAQPVDPTA